VRFGIIVNPAAGKQAIGRKRAVIKGCEEVFGPGTIVAGWDTRSSSELCDCAKTIATRVDVLVVAGGDGTFSDIVNTIDPAVTFAYVPLGSGNAWRNTLGLPRSTKKIAERIRDGATHLIDLVLCEGHRKGLLASVGIEGYALSEREKLLQKGVTGFDAYFRATTKSILGGYRAGAASVTIDGENFEVDNTISLVVTKTPFYGYGFKVVPGAKLADAHLHVLLVTGETPVAISGVVTSLLGGNRIGQYFTCERVSIKTRELAPLQIDGNIEGEGNSFAFRILPEELRIRY
jgi:diacylglycerol kinase family enzyme